MWGWLCSGSLRICSSHAETLSSEYASLDLISPGHESHMLKAAGAACCPDMVRLPAGTGGLGTGSWGRATTVIPVHACRVSRQLRPKGFYRSGQAGRHI